MKATKELAEAGISYRETFSVILAPPLFEKDPDTGEIKEIEPAITLDYVIRPLSETEMQSVLRNVDFSSLAETLNLDRDYLKSLSVEERDNLAKQLLKDGKLTSETLDAFVEIGKQYCALGIVEPADLDLTKLVGTQIQQIGNRIEELSSLNVKEVRDFLKRLQETPS
jgi:hypothetical protein